MLFHYGLRTWQGVGRGAIHLYGHNHGRLPGDRQSCDAGVDAWSYRPVALPEIREFLGTLPERCSAAALLLGQGRGRLPRPGRRCTLRPGKLLSPMFNYRKV